MKNRGMGTVYLRPDSAVYWIRYHHRGRKFRESCGSTNRADAVRLLKKRLAELAAGRPVGPSVERTTFEDLAIILRNDYKANGRRSANRMEASLAHLTGFFGYSLALDISTDRVTAYIAQRQDEGAAAASINRELAALKRAFVLAHKAGKVAQRPSISMLEENNRRKGFFEPEQFQAVLERLPDFLQPVVATAYITGWRLRSEILTRQKHHVDIDAGWLRLDPGETKNGEGRNFPLTPELCDILSAQLEKTHEFELATGRVVPWLFHKGGNPIGSFRKTWIAACGAAGVPGRLLHDFRRTAVRNLERAGVPRSAAMAMVGHKTEAIYRRYAICDEAMLKEGAVKLAALHQGERRMRRIVVPLRKADLP